jgi:TP901 family phage tail tape measure protein
MAGTSIKISGNVTEALAALDALGIKAGETAAETESKLGGAAEKTGGIFQKLGNTLGNFGLPFSESLTKVGDKLSDTETKGQKFGAALSSVGKAAVLGAGAGFAVVAVESVKLGEAYQQTTAGIQASAGISASAAKSIGDAFLTTAGQSTFSAQEMASAFSPVAGVVKNLNGGVLTAAASMDVMKAATMGAEASGGNLTTTTSDLTGVMQAFQIKTSDSSTTMNALFNASKTTGVSIDSLSSTVEKLHSKLGVASPSLADTSALMVDMTEAGVTGRAATAGLNTGMTTLLGGSKATNAELSTLGVSVYNSSGQFVGMQSVISQLQPKLAGMTEQQQALAEKSLFGAGAASAMNKVVSGGVAAFNSASAAVNQKGAADKAAEAQASTLKGTMEKLKATGEDLGTKFGIILIPKIQELGAATADVINWFTKHKAITEALAAVIGGVLAVAVAAYAVHLVDAAAKSVISSAKIVGSWVGIGTSADAAAAESTAADAEVAAGSEEMATSSIAAFGAMIGAAAGWVATQAAQLAEGVAGMVTWGAEHAVMAASFVAENLAMIVSATAAFVAENLATLGIIAGIALLIAGIVFLATHWKQTWKIIQDVAGDAKKFIVKIFDDVVDFAKKWGPLILTAVAPMIGIPLLIMQHWGVIETFFENLWSDVTGYFSRALTWISNFFESLPGKIMGWLSGAGTWLLSLGGDIIHGLLDGINAYWKLVQDFYVKMPEAILGYLANAGTWLTQKGKDVITSFWNGIKAIWLTVTNWAGGIHQDIVGYLNGAETWLVQAGEDIIKGLVKGITNVAGSVGNAIKGAVGNIPGASSVLGAMGVHLGALGGIVTKPTFALLGEGGETEYVIPQHVLSGIGGTNGLPSLPGLSSGGMGNAPTPPGAFSSGGGGSKSVTLNVSTPQANPTQLATEMAWILRPYLGT